ncbi:putative lipoprotein superfamily protein [Shigella dysenteriae WRSd3]|uniref:Putative lipoprotein superfamily protein n=1 Tax=Shigella dysenteriae WRSd3 TaxID=1401327 RepID=A0A090NWH2_SHIDY|nr:putative lipoprotein superfamily protein [Shigella dysenteriae WRSd3]
MRYRSLSLLIPCALLLSACTTVTPAYKDNGPRTGSCVQGGGLTAWPNNSMTTAFNIAAMTLPPYAPI